MAATDKEFGEGIGRAFAGAEDPEAVFDYIPDGAQRRGGDL